MPDIEAVITDAIADQGDIAPSDTSTDTETVDISAGTDGTVDTTTQQQVDEDPFAKEYGLATRRADGKDNRIPYPRVKAIADNQVKKVVGQIAKELGITKAEAELKLEDIIGELGTRKTKFGEYESRVQNMDAVERLMEADPDAFMTQLATINPAYKKFVEKQQAAVDRTDTSRERQADAVDANDPMPQPDLDLGEGRMTFSMKGLEKLRAWDKRQTLREANEGFKKQLDERFKPIDEAQKAEQVRKQGEAVKQRAAEAIDRKLAKMSKRPGWKENEKAILDAITANPDLDIEDAYIDVVIPKLAGDRTKMREEILAELKKAPASTSTSVQQPAADGAGTPKSMEDIIRESIKSLKR
jgi:hypothetical protein